jgi:hypothetical protein
MRPTVQRPMVLLPTARVDIRLGMYLYDRLQILFRKCRNIFKRIPAQRISDNRSSHCPLWAMSGSLIVNESPLYVPISAV